MTYFLLVEIAWKSAVTSGAALLLLALLRNRTAGERSWVAHAGLLATLLLPAAILLLPDWQVDAPVALAPTASDAVTTGAVAAASPSAAPAAPAAASFDLLALSVWLYAIPALLLLAATLTAVLRLFAIRRRASVMVEQVWLSALAHAQRRMGFKHGTALLVSNELSSPVSWGLLRPIILLSDETVSSRGDAEAIIAHELAHVARLDWAKLLLARAATALFWFNPLVWMLARLCHQLREEAADDAVLRSDVPETDYAALLVSVARHENKAALLAAHGVAPGRDSLKRRVTRILDRKLSRAPARAGWIGLCSAGATLISAPLAALTPVTPLPASAATVAHLQRPLALQSPIALSQPVASVAARPVAAASAAAAPLEPENEQLEMAAREPEEDLPPPPRSGRRADGLLSPDALVAMQVHGVSADYVGELAAISPLYARFTPDQLIGLKIHGMTAERVRAMHALGFRDLSADQLTSLGVHGVTPDFAREMAGLGVRGLDADTLTAMRIHAVTPAYVREFRAAGYDDLTAKELIDMRIHGVSVDSARRSRDDP